MSQQLSSRINGFFQTLDHSLSHGSFKSTSIIKVGWIWVLIKLLFRRELVEFALFHFENRTINVYSKVLLIKDMFHMKCYKTSQLHCQTQFPCNFHAAVPIGSSVPTRVLFHLMRTGIPIKSNFPPFLGKTARKTFQLEYLPSWIPFSTLD